MCLLAYVQTSSWLPEQYLLEYDLGTPTAKSLLGFQFDAYIGVDFAHMRDVF